MWYYYLAAGLITFWFFLLRPRSGGKDSPPLVTASTVVRLPLVGVIAEFLKNPNEMMKRCYKDYGEVFTIPVSPLPLICPSICFVTFVRIFLSLLAPNSPTTFKSSPTDWFLLADFPQAHYFLDWSRGTVALFQIRR